MFIRKIKISLILVIITSLAACESNNQNNDKIHKKFSNKKKQTIKNNLTLNKVNDNKDIVLNDKNAVQFFFEYLKKNKEDKIRIKTSYGDIEIILYENTPYHRANFIYLTKKKYFNNTTFHRVVKNFIIQGGNSDSYEISKKRSLIGRYLLPPDIKKNLHNRGVISMPSSEINNPHKMASPYEFFIVNQKPGAYHLDGDYTAFGEVIKGMNIVDMINSQEVDKNESPIHNIFIEVEIIE
jgi:peptidyl-prolyl cis-trans isomerase A (cyclophilin A)